MPGLPEIAPGTGHETVLRKTNERQAVLVRSHKAFVVQGFQQGRAHAEIVLLRLAEWSESEKGHGVADVSAEHAAALVSAFCVSVRGRNRIGRSGRPRNAAPQSSFRKHLGRTGRPIV